MFYAGATSPAALRATWGAFGAAAACCQRGLGKQVAVAIADRNG